MPEAAAIQGNGRILGDVRDYFGGVIPGVPVVVLSSQGAADRSTRTNTRGEYAIDGLPPGTYAVRASSMPGFKSVTADVTIGDTTLTVPFRLPVGALSEEVHVRASPAGAMTTSSESPLPPAACATSADCYSAAGSAYASGAFGQTEALLARAFELSSIRRGFTRSVVPSAVSSTGPVRMGGDIKAPAKIHDVAPIYPSDALASGVSGTVTIDAVIAKDGTVVDARVIDGHAELDASAVNAVRLWKFTPTLLDGVPVEVNAAIKVVYEIR
jgi:TonB family protein